MSNQATQATIQPSQRYNHGINQQHYLIQHDNKLKCVCQLCTCGKHHCPKPRIKGNFSTAYTDHYKNVKIPASKSPPPQYKYQPRHYNSDTLRTNYQQTYISKPMVSSPSKFQNLGSKIVYHAPFIGQTSYKDQFKPFQIKPSQNPEEIGSPVNLKKPNVKFEGVTSYKAHYVEPPKAESKLISQPNYQKAQVPFYGASSYKNDFPQYKIQTRQPIVPQAYKGPHVKFEGSTSYLDQYKGYQMKNPQNGLANSRSACVVDKLNVPSVNYINEQNHIYYSPDQRKFV